MKTIIKTDLAPAAIGPYSQAVTVGNMVYTSGSISLNSKGELVAVSDISGQTHQVLANLKAILEAAGSDMDHVVKTTCFIKNMNDFAIFNNIYAGYFINNPPARSTVEVARLPKDVLVEIEAIAIKKS
jgi:2-iminobutanoate/2-iminopropanoate deaminase